MNILVVSGQPWRDTNSVGNTMTNLFEGWDCRDTFSHIYFRPGLPSNHLCDEEFQILSSDMLKNILMPSRIGKTRKSAEETPREINVSSKESRLINLIHRFSIAPAYYLDAALWIAGTWKNNRLKAYLDRSDPDVIFCFAIGSEGYYQIIQFVKEYTAAKLVLFIVDDVCGPDDTSLDRIGRRNKRHAAELIRQADLLYAITDEMRDAYQGMFNRDIRVLHKGADLSHPVKEGINDPLKMVYAGNLLYGREATLLELAQAVDRVNAGQTRIVLDIYSITLLDEKERRSFNSLQGVRLNDALPYSEIVSIMQASDIVLHVESFEPDQIRYVRYSFSTKIVDCLQSGSVVMGVGPGEIASMRYLKKIPGTIVVSEGDDLAAVLCSIGDDPSQLPEMAKESRRYAEEHLERGVIQQRLAEELHSLVR